jgi:hypothetical protein
VRKKMTAAAIAGAASAMLRRFFIIRSFVWLGLLCDVPLICVVVYMSGS